MRFLIDDKPINQLLLDPNNFRFLDLPQWRRRQSGRFHDLPVQDATLRLLESISRYNLNELRQSFLSNGYVKLERIVVVPYEHCEGYYLVVEGNRRIAALKTLLRDNLEGTLTLTQDQINDFSTVPVAILQPEGEPLLSARRVIMGIRHVAGPQEWGAYQQAYLILQLVDEEGQQIDDVARHLNVSVVEARRRYRAIRALKSMENDELYSSVAKPEFYRFFHELISLPNVREFFSWNQDETTFRDQEKAHQFYELIEPREPGSTPKLRTFIDVRQLRQVIGNSAAEAALLDPDQPLSAALALAQANQIAQVTSDIVNEARRFRRVLEDAQIDAVSGLSIENIQFLEELASLISSRIEQCRWLVQ